MTRILIAYLVRNSGHHSAALALESAFRSLNPGVETMCVDLLEYSHPGWSAIIQKMYMSTIRRTPELWDALYDNVWIDYLTRRVRKMVQRGSSKPLVQLMETFAPDACVCTQAHPLAVLSGYAARNDLTQLPLWGVVTDFIPHRFWIVPHYSGLPIHYSVADEAAAERLVWLGIKASRIRVLGIPIHPDKLAGASRKTCASNSSLRVLVMGGSRGLGAKYHTIRALDRSKERFTIDVVTGANKSLRAKLIRNRVAFNHPLRVRGYVRDTLALMKRSSLLVTKPGGLTVAEACAVGVPMVLVRPLPGQERGNTDVLVRQGAAIHVQRDCDVQHAVTDLLHNRDLLHMMGARARTLGRASAAVDIAAAVLNQLGPPAASS